MEKLETATLAGGCFWCTEAVFKRLKGVLSVTPGYSGGNTKDPSYEEVLSGKTGHAEAIQIIFDPKIISFPKILDVFWATHDPTSLNKQGADVGTEYRSAIFYHTQKQKNEAEKSKLPTFVTEITPFKNFFKAEDYHKNFYDKNRSAPYCQIVIDPKITKLYELSSKENIKLK